MYGPTWTKTIRGEQPWFYFHDEHKERSQNEKILENTWVHHRYSLLEILHCFFSFFISMMRNRLGGSLLLARISLLIFMMKISSWKIRLLFIKLRITKSRTLWVFWMIVWSMVLMMDRLLFTIFLIIDRFCILYIGFTLSSWLGS